MSQHGGDTGYVNPNYVGRHRPKRGQIAGFTYGDTVDELGRKIRVSFDRLMVGKKRLFGWIFPTTTKFTYQGLSADKLKALSAGEQTLVTQAVIYPPIVLPPPPPRPNRPSLGITLRSVPDRPGRHRVEDAYVWPTAAQTALMERQ